MTGRLLNLLFAIAGAVLLSQLPAFSDQYLQRLGGRLDQARFDVYRIAQAAEAENMSLTAYIHTFTASDQSPHRRQGRIMQEQITQLARLERAFGALRAAGDITRPIVFLRYAETEMVASTLSDFSPGLPLSAAGFGYAMIGALGGLAVRLGLGRVFALIHRVAAT